MLRSIFGLAISYPLRHPSCAKAIVSLPLLITLLTNVQVASLRLAALVKRHCIQLGYHWFVMGRKIRLKGDEEFTLHNWLLDQLSN